MTGEQQVAYWQHHARKWQQRAEGMNDYDQLKQTAEQYQRLVEASQTEQERAVVEARRQGRTEALSETGGQLVDQWMRAAANGRLPEEGVNALLQGLDRSRFLKSDHSVDTDKVFAFVSTIAPASAAAPAATAEQGASAQQPAPAQVTAPPRGPDFGQGHPATARPSGLDAGREIARARFAKQQPQRPAAQAV